MRDAERPAAARETIAAIATAPGRGAIGVVRLSGPRTEAIAQALIGALPAPRRAQLAVFRDRDGEAIDEGLALYFPAPHSYTGEAMLELQGHGGPVVMQALLAACLDAGARPAAPGEFTQRAYLEDRIDLAQAEAVADLIDAASGAAARMALRSLQGAFSARVAVLAAQLTELRALTEALLDFPEEEIDPLQREEASRRLARLRAALDALLEASRQGSLLQAGIHVVLAGRPNVGKSSLLNRLAGDEHAIVTDVPGTTRDAVRVSIVLDGIPVVVVDTAGLRESHDVVERIGIERARREIAGADVVVLVQEAGCDDADARALAATVPPGVPCIRVLNKIDLDPHGECEAGTVLASAKTGAGIDALREAILHAAGWHPGNETLYLARERHLRALGAARAHLAAAEGEQSHWELFAEELRLAHAALGEISGAPSADALLGEIFSRFCIGK